VKNVLLEKENENESRIYGDFGMEAVVYKIANELNELRPTNIGITDDKGTFIASNFSGDKSHDLISKIVKQYATIPINNYIKQDLPNSNYFLYIYNICSSIFIVCITNAQESLVLRKFGQITRDYGSLLLDASQPPPKKAAEITQDDRIIAVAFSKAGDLGPATVSWLPKSLGEKDLFEISAKSLLILSAGFDRSTGIHETSSLIPFPSLNSIGSVYTFGIPDENARGKSYDATISVLLKEEFRKALLERLELFEKGAKAIAEKILAGEEPDSLIAQLYTYVAEALDKKVEAFTSPQTEQIIPTDQKLKKAMVDEIKNIQIEHPKSLELDFSRKHK
jgi:hypothetical protein